MTWREIIPEGETAKFEGYATELRAMQRERARGRPGFRGLHTKQHIGAVGTLTMAPDLPSELRVGPFTAASYPLYVRFSNGQSGFHKDSVGDIRGFAIKLVGVPGKKLIPPLADCVTQDFLLIQLPSLPVRDPHEFLALVRAGKKGALGLVPRLIGALGFKRTLRIVRGALKMPRVRSLATSPFYSGAPLAFGAAACKVAVFPAQHDERAAGKTRDALREDIEARLRAGPLAWDLKVQLFVDEATTPIEDVSVRWPEDKSPWRTIGRIELPRQDVASPAGKAIDELVTAMSFDPWHAVPELRPIGAVMRARSPAYRESILERGAAPEPTGVLPPG